MIAEDEVSRRNSIYLPNATKSIVCYEQSLPVDFG